LKNVRCNFEQVVKTLYSIVLKQNKNTHKTRFPMFILFVGSFYIYLYVETDRFFQYISLRRNEKWCYLAPSLL